MDPDSITDRTPENLALVDQNFINAIDDENFKFFTENFTGSFSNPNDARSRVVERAEYFTRFTMYTGNGSMTSHSSIARRISKYLEAQGFEEITFSNDRVSFKWTHRDEQVAA